MPRTALVISSRNGKEESCRNKLSLPAALTNKKKNKLCFPCICTFTITSGRG